MDFSERFTTLLGNDRGAITKLSKAVGASTGLISAWKSGEKKPSFEYIPKLAQFFKVTTDFLLCAEEGGANGNNASGVTGSAFFQGVNSGRVNVKNEVEYPPTDEAIQMATRWTALDDDGRLVVGNAIVQEERRMAAEKRSG
jgi:transcriptional regulator with XRE-family HTH domain